MRSYSGHNGLARRTFLGGLATGGLSVEAAQATPPQPQPLAARLPDAMTRPGGADLPYGLPAVHEAQVERSLSMAAGFAVWRTPLEHQRGIITPSGLHFAVHHNGVPDTLDNTTAIR